MSLLRYPPDPDGGVPIRDERLSATFRPGLAPAAPPRHEGLAQPLGTGRLDGEAGWLEARREGVLLTHMDPLSAVEAACVLAQIARALECLHAAGLVHGALAPERIRIGLNGEVELTGAGLAGGTREGDLAAFAELMDHYWMMGEAPAGDSAEALAAELEVCLEQADPEFDRARLAPPVPTLPLDARPAVWEPDHAFLDEVGMDLGADGGRGLLDLWGTTGSVSLPGAITGAMEGTLSGDAPEEHKSGVALLARLLAPPERAPAADRFAAVEGRPLEAIKALIADEPLDPVPLESPWSPEPLTVPEEPAATAQPDPEEVSNRALGVVALLTFGLMLAAALAVIYVLR